MNAFSAFLLISDVPPESIAVYVVLLQSADPNGAINESQDTLRDQYKNVTGKGITTRKFEEYHEILQEKGIVPSDETVYPMVETKPTNREDIEDIVERLEKSVEDVKPDPRDFPDHERICAALTACEALTVGITRTRKPVIDPETEDPVIDGGEVQKFWKKKWDYSFVEGKLVSSYGAEKVIDAIFQMHIYDQWEQLRHEKFEERRRSMRSYLISVLDGEQDVQEDSRPELTY